VAEALGGVKLCLLFFKEKRCDLYIIYTDALTPTFPHTLLIHYPYTTHTLLIHYSYTRILRAAHEAPHGGPQMTTESGGPDTST
jgi:hypothetical protein